MDLKKKISIFDDLCILELDPPAMSYHTEIVGFFISSCFFWICKVALGVQPRYPCTPKLMEAIMKTSIALGLPELVVTFFILTFFINILFLCSFSLRYSTSSL